MSSSASGARGTEGGRLGGARAAFVASLGRKVNDTRELLLALEEDPSSKGMRDELRRRLHALGAGARLLRFDAMARALQEALGVLDRGAAAGSVREQDAAFVAQTLDDLPALAWGEAPPRDAPPQSAEEPESELSGQLPYSVLVVGGEALADALTDDAALRARAFECERTDDVQTALELARAYAPDAIVVDADVPHAPELVEALLDDPLTEPVPVVVVGTFGAPEDTARFVALGVAKALAKPLSPEVLRRTCDELLEERAGRTMRVTLGEPTLEQLASRLAEELKTALLESVDGPARSHRVPLGEGTEVLGALWGAIARVQEIISQKTGGAIRFGGDAPEGAIALAPWLHQELPGADRMAGRGRGAAADVRLNGRRVVVADDDPGVTWFISDLLRTAGCDVHEALDGAAALDIAFRVQPELVVSDILMPGLDGFALCRALRRDVALRDTPVILLSWKEDLLQRVRELGASAAAYMRKESDSRAILARVREVLRPRARVEMRLRSEGEVRGRLDGLTPRLLLDLVCSIRKDARVAVRDATYFYEVEIRAGAPRKATRTASDGSYQRGERALAGLLGVGAGRFVVTPTNEAVRGDLAGTLFDQLAPPIAAARGALAAATGSRTMNVDRIAIDPTVLEEYLAATPDPANSLIKRLAGGTSPRDILLAGDASPSLIEDVLADLALRGAIRGVEGAGGADLLTPAVDAALRLLKGAEPPRRSVPPNARPSVVPPPAILRARSPAEAPVPAGAPVPAETHVASEARLRAEARVAEEAPPARVGARHPSPAPPPRSARTSDPGDEGVPSSLEDAVMRELSDRSPEPHASRSPGSDPPPIIEPSELRPRSSNPPGELGATEEEEAPESFFPSMPPDAIVPGASSSEEVPVAPEVFPPPSVAPPPYEPSPWEVESLRPSEPSPPQETLPAREREGEESPPTVPYVSPLAIATMRLPMRAPTPQVDATQPLPPAPRLAPAPLPAHGEPTTPQRRSRWALVLAFGLLGVAIGAAVRATGGDPQRASERQDIGSATTARLGLPPPSASPVPPPVASSATPPSARSATPESDELPPGAEVPPGYGFLQVSAPVGARVRIDGAIAGIGPLTSSVAAPGYHEVRVEQGDRESKHVIEVRGGKTTRITSVLPP